MRNLKFIFTLLVLFIILFTFGAVSYASSPSVVASTAWTGAIAAAAGAEDVTIFAPFEMRHPAEYDFKPSDIQIAVSADWIVWAGYESFIERLINAANISTDKVIRVHTNNSPLVLHESVKTLANKLETTDNYNDWLEEFEQLVDEIEKAAIVKQVDEMRVAVQAHQQRWVEWLGYDIVAVYGPGDLTPTQVANIFIKEPDAIIDNWHTAQGTALQSENAEYFSLINFPGKDNTETLLDVLRYNSRELGLID